jgi:hypothetical protein
MTEALHKFRSGPVALAQALHGLTLEDSARVPEPGKWSINQIVRHVADTEIVVAMRLRLIVAEDRPTLSPFDQDKWAAALGYADANPFESLALFEALRIDTTKMLEALPPEAFNRVSVHPERGEKTLLEWVTLFGNHVYSHVEQIKKLRSAH